MSVQVLPERLLKSNRNGCSSWSECARHGTRELAAAGALLRSEVDGSILGALRPDALVAERRRTVGVLDAKYKQLHPTALAPNGPQREDLYQLAAYLARFGTEPEGAWGILAYPLDTNRDGIAPAESRSPWRLDDSSTVHFVALPHDMDAAVGKLRAVLGSARRVERPPLAPHSASL
jgi:5-methylcytosine-specific restriction enzyme subunit McrC